MRLAPLCVLALAACQAGIHQPEAADLDAAIAANPVHAGHDHHATATVDAAAKRLLDGNAYYVSMRALSADISAQRTAALATGQNPFAAILTCADSRVPPELLFNQGFGDLFVLRVAGNVANDHVLGSLEYAVEHLGVRYILVMGHERCGAVDAAMSGAELPGHIASLGAAIAPAVREARSRQGATLQDCVEANARLVADSLRKSGPILAAEVEHGGLVVEAAVCDLDSSQVIWLR